MSEMSAVLGIPPVFTYKEREYRVVARTFEVEALLVAHLEDRALAKIRQFAGKMSASDYRECLSNWNRDCTTGTYEFGSQRFVDFYLTDAGLKYHAYLRLKKHQPDVTQILVDEIFRDEKAWDELCQAMARGDQDPNRQAGQQEV